jgi:hypothetical protein
MASIAPPHALLVAHWGKDGAAVLSLPTKEYFQSSGWVEEHHSEGEDRTSRDITELRSVRSGSDFWADGQSHARSSSAFYSFAYTSDAGAGTMSAPMSPEPFHTFALRGKEKAVGRDAADNRSEGLAKDNMVDEAGAQDAFISGMIFALSRRLMPGLPYTPSWSGEPEGSSRESERGRWRLDECLRYGDLCRDEPCTIVD